MNSAIYHSFACNEYNYNLLFFLKGMQMVVMKPASAQGEAQAWLFRKVSDYGLEPPQ